MDPTQTGSPPHYEGFEELRSRSSILNIIWEARELQWQAHEKK